MSGYHNNFQSMDAMPIRVHSSSGTPSPSSLPTHVQTGSSLSFVPSGTPLGATPLSFYGNEFGLPPMQGYTPFLVTMPPQATAQPFMPLQFIQDPFAHQPCGSRSRSVTPTPSNTMSIPSLAFFPMPTPLPLPVAFQQIQMPTSSPPAVAVEPTYVPSRSTTEEASELQNYKYIPYCPVKGPVGSLAKHRNGESLLIFHNNQFYVSEDFVGKYVKRKIRKSAELSVFSVDAHKEKLCAISASINVNDLKTQYIRGKKFVQVELLRRTKIDEIHDITQGCMKIKCAVKDCMDSGDIQFCRRNGENVVTQVYGWLRDSGVRENMVLAECLDFSGSKKTGIHLSKAQRHVNYRLTFKFDFVEEMQQYQDSQVLVKIQCNSSKGVMIQHWDWYLRNLDMHLQCLVKCTASSFVFGVVLSSVRVLADDDLMERVIDVIAEYKCRISHYIKGGKMKADSANKLTLLIQCPPLLDFEDQKYTASRVMKKIHDLLAPVTNDHNLRCATAEIAEVVTLTKMVSLVWSASMICGNTSERFEEALRNQGREEGDCQKLQSISDFLRKLSSKLEASPVSFCPPGQSFEDICSPNEDTRQLAKQILKNYTQQCANEVHQLIKDSWICDLVNKPDESEVDRRELIHGIDFLGAFIEKMITDGDFETVQYLRLVLLDGRRKEDLEQDSCIYNPGRAKTWLECFKWKFNKSEKEQNLMNLKDILTKTWGRSKKTESSKSISITGVKISNPCHMRIAKTLKLDNTVGKIPAPHARIPKSRTLQDVVEFAMGAKMLEANEAKQTLERNLDLKKRGLRTIEKYAAAGTELPLLSTWENTHQ